MNLEGFVPRVASQRGALVAAIFVLALCATALGAPFVPSLDPYGTNLNHVLDPPSVGHWLGYDDIGRDVFSRLVYASRVSLLASGTAVLVALVIGLPTGLVSGYFKGPIDFVLARLMEALMGFPPLLLAILVVALLRPGLISAMVAIGIVVAPAFFRVVRAATLNIGSEMYVQAAEVFGSSALRTIVRHVLPNIRGPLLVQIALTMSTAIIVEAALSFIGLGVQLPESSWGSMLREASTNLGDAPLTYVLSPAAIIVLVVIAFNALADGFRTALGSRA